MTRVWSRLRAMLRRLVDGGAGDDELGEELRAFVEHDAESRILSGMNPEDGRSFLMRDNDRWDVILIDAYRGPFVPFHLLTKEFYTLVKQRLSSGGAAAFNVHDNTKLFTSTLLTLRSVFPGVHLYPTRLGETITVVTAEPAPPEAFAQDRDVRSPAPVVIRREAAADNGTNAEHLEQVGRRGNRRHALSGTVTR